MPQNSEPEPSGSLPAPLQDPDPTRAGSLEERERHLDATVWRPEILAQACARQVEDLWDQLNRATNRLAAAAATDPGTVSLPDWGPESALPHGIRTRQSRGTLRLLRPEEWPRWLDGFVSAGWELVQVEFRHNRFETDAAGRARQSVFSFAAHFENPAQVERAALTGDLVVAWVEGTRPDQAARMATVDATGLTLQTRRGKPPFREELNVAVPPVQPRFSVDPLILHDLDGDGRSEILLPSVNRVYRRAPDGKYSPATLCRFPPGVIFTAVVADFTGDGRADLLCARPEGLVLYVRGTAGTDFEEPEQLAWLAPGPLPNPMVLTCGDVDGDGDLDVFLGQYRVPTLGQVLQPWYYDANDGFPAYLLRSDGAGRFTDATADSGLEAKRGRRTYSASFADLNADGWLDLVVVSDFAGIDVYRNEGGVRFREVTAAWVPDAKGFGMAHALADFNADGRLDVLMIGMNSPTVDRLEHLGLRRPGSAEDFGMRPRMAYGNRLLIAQPEGGFSQPALGQALARTGWSWGCSAADFDNDGFPDLYIANGLQSQASVRDVEPEFWLHDLYVEPTVDEREATRYFMDKFDRTRGRGWSYGGYEKNRLFLNRNGASFVETAFLMGVALEEDGRNVVTDDLDGDGRMDLVVTTFEVWPEVRQSLRVYRNELTETGRWIGFRFPEMPGGAFPIGTTVTLTTNAGRQATGQVVTGDSHRSQHAATLHFGLGQAEEAVHVEIRAADRKTRQLGPLEPNRYHAILADRTSSSRPGGRAGQEPD